MTKEELYKLKEEVLKNKEVFSMLNTQYNVLLTKINNINSKKKRQTDAEFILINSHWLYWVRFFIILGPLIFLHFADGIIILLIFTNLILMLFDQKYFLPAVLRRKKMKAPRKTKLEEEQDVLYKKLNEARDLYNKLKMEYEKSLNKLNEAELKEYQEYEDSIVAMTEEVLEERHDDSMATHDIRKLNKKYEGEE